MNAGQPDAGILGQVWGGKYQRIFHKYLIYHILIYFSMLVTPFNSNSLRHVDAFCRYNLFPMLVLNFFYCIHDNPSTRALCVHTAWPTAEDGPQYSVSMVQWVGLGTCVWDHGLRFDMNKGERKVVVLKWLKTQWSKLHMCFDTGRISHNDVKFTWNEWVKKCLLVVTFVCENK